MSDTVTPPSQPTSVELTEAERAWIAAHPEIIVGSSLDVPPTVFEDEQGQYSGLLVDYLDLLQQRIGLRFRLHLTSIPNVFKHAHERKTDIIGILFLVEELKYDFNFTQVLFQSPHYIFAKSDNRQDNWHQGLSVLQDKRVGYLNGLRPIEILRATQPQIEFIPFETNPQMAEALLAEQIQAIVSNMTFEYWRQQQVHTGFKIVAQITEIENEISMAVRNDWPELLTILNKGLTTISKEEKQTILNRWIGSYAPIYAPTLVTKIELTPKEQSWLLIHPEIVYCFSPSWPPYDYSEAGQHQGIFADYIELFSRRLNMKLVPVVSKNWLDVLEKVRSRQCDFISGAVQLPERESYLYFTKPYLNVTQVLLAKPDKPFVSGVAVLSQESIGVLPNTAAEAFLRRDFPNMPLVSQSIEQLIRLLDDEEIYAFVLPLEHASHILGPQFYNYKVIAKLEYNTPISVAVRHDWPELLSIMNKTVDSLTQADHNQIRDQWPTHTLRQQVDYRLLWQVVGMAVLIVLLMSYWNRKLARTQRELVIAKKAAEHANHAKTTFLANMSHELRTPLNAILGFSDIMLRHSPSPAQRDYLHYIQQSGNSLLDLIKDTLDLSKVETGKLKLDYQPCDVRLLLQDMTYPMHLEFEEKALDLVVDISDNIPPALLIDDVRLRQIVLNLLNNARKFTEQGHVRLQVTAEIQYNLTTLLISVADSGPGIATEDQRRIFDAFAQIERPEHAGGSGLGLTIVRELTRLLGGTISLHSEPGQGSTFQIRIPNLEVPILCEKESRLEHEYFHFAPAQVLIADDIPANRLFLRIWLEDAGLHCEEAKNGQELLDYALQQTPDIILTDIKMPLLTGEKVAKRLKTNPNTAEIPIIGITASAMMEDSIRYHQIFADCLFKPLEHNALLKCLARFLPHQHQITPALPDSTSLFVLPPDEALSELRRLAELGMFSQVKQWAQTWQQHDERYQELTRQVLDLAYTFKRQRLLEFLAQIKPADKL